MRRRLAWTPPPKAGRKPGPTPGEGPVPDAGQAAGTGANGRTPPGTASKQGSAAPPAVASIPGPDRGYSIAPASGSPPAAKPGSGPEPGSGPGSPRPARASRRFQSPEALASALRGAAYVAGEGLGTAAFLALSLGKPLLLEGAPGVGKTEAGKALAEVLGRDLIRLQCYEGMDSSAALYEWNYPAQMLALRRAGERDVDLYDEAFLIERPLLAALRTPARTLLLIDEIDRSDHEFEAFLLEFLSDFQISIPETGTLRATEPPVVVLTSNRTRELHEALRRRCVYDWIAYPEPEKEIEIVGLRARDVAERTARAVVAAVGELREMPLAKPPGVAEAIDWAEAAEMLAASGTRWPLAFRRAIGTALKDEEDLHFVADRLDGVLERAARQGVAL